MELGRERLDQILRNVGDWKFALEMREDGEWAVFSVPINNTEHIPPAEIFHALLLNAIAIDQRGLITEETDQKWDFLLEDPE